MHLLLPHHDCSFLLWVWEEALDKTTRVAEGICTFCCHKIAADDDMNESKYVRRFSRRCMCTWSCRVVPKECSPRVCLTDTRSDVIRTGPTMIYRLTAKKGKERTQLTRLSIHDVVWRVSTLWPLINHSPNERWVDIFVRVEATGCPPTLAFTVINFGSKCPT